MEIGQHCLDHFEFKPSFKIWIDENVRGGGACHDGSRANPRRMFKSSNRRRTHRDDAPRRAQSLVDGGSCLGGNGVRLGMNLMILDVLDADGLKSSEADMQCYLGGLDPALPDAIED